MNKRSRAPNFTNEDAFTLVDLVERYKNILECRKTDGVSPADKQAVWQSVATQFNAVAKGPSRSADNLKSAFQNMKHKTRKMNAESKMQLPIELSSPLVPESIVESVEENGQMWKTVSTEMGRTPEECQSQFGILIKKMKMEESLRKNAIRCTGGGPPPPTNNTDPLSDKIKAIMGPQMEGLFTKYGGDSSFMQQQELQKPLSCRKVPIEVEMEETDKTEDMVLAATTSPHLENIFTTPISKFSRSDLKKPRHPMLVVEKNEADKENEKGKRQKVTLAEKFSGLAEDKAAVVLKQKELLELQITNAREELFHRREMRQLEMQEKVCEIAHKRFIREAELSDLKNKNMVEDIVTEHDQNH